MITRQDIGELAKFESGNGCAISFYFQPIPPKDKSHREEAILIKDLVKDAVKRAAREGKNGGTKADLERIQQMAENLHNNGGKAKAVFACAEKNMWLEFDLPPRLTQTQIHINERFHLRPLTAIADVLPKVGIVVADRTKARIFELWMDSITEVERLTWELPRRGKSDGFFGFDAGHAERKVGNEAMHNFKELAERIKAHQEARNWEKLVFGCRDETWPEIQEHLHTYTTKKTIGHFAIDAANATNQEVRREAEQLVGQQRLTRTRDMVQAIVGEAHRDARGALGLRHVLNALEKGEVQALLLGRGFRAEVVRCTHCGHLDTRLVKTCAVCSSPTQHVDDVADLLLGIAVRNGIEIVHVPEELDPQFAVKGSIGALLRFRADQNTNEVLRPAV